MKKIILSCIFCLTFLNIYSQSFPENIPELLINKIVKPKELSEISQQYAYENFYLEFDKDKKQFTKDDRKNKPFATGLSYSITSDYSKLVGKEFKVLEIFEIVPKYSFSDKEYAIEIENSEIGKIFYKYNPKHEHNFELEVVNGLDYPADFFCSKIKYEKDKFKDEEIFFTPNPYEHGVSFVKTIENGKTSIYLSASVNRSTLNIGKRGLYILFEDGAKITKAEVKISTKVSKGRGYIYNAFIKLTQEDIKLLISKNITDIRVYIYDDKIDKNSANKIKEYLKCLYK